MNKISQLLIKPNFIITINLDHGIAFCSFLGYSNVLYFDNSFYFYKKKKIIIWVQKLFTKMAKINNLCLQGYFGLLNFYSIFIYKKTLEYYIQVSTIKELYIKYTNNKKFKRVLLGLGHNYEARPLTRKVCGQVCVLQLLEAISEVEHTCIRIF